MDVCRLEGSQPFKYRIAAKDRTKQNETVFL